ncbi:Aminoglycoside phosphotransferase [Penicillium atrosanguineum]|uniref:Hydroxymethylglutaryl-CoA synthase n=1 Tax=Penicillium atrosanguineum TaxID=1132637 RepID=A0A9W9PVW3_9EURO|nr:Aminoglycoside phosphotransferase [Penicillium atrosanguineum]KAJ5141222.1 Hydroxymethylglutaryl-CoA synthase [Penicillium atrosanguineum]KAJ5290556.1 Aminoglycoside phosphotransferase [Penicillium atrosanguineum]KAJ5308379.1 Hydroxymethylglutaryl-CoA synthase [Penicillium atrosanguineum]
MSARPQNIGIKAIEVYFPSQCVDQVELEKYDGVSAGKYTIGLGQTKMSFCDDREDIYSMSLTTLSSLMSKYNIDPKSIGRLEVGTETLLDKSKSVKSVLMQLFTPSGNTNIEGIDTINACYGGTNAVFNSINWLESSAWDGRDAIVVCGDIALYAAGAARPTGGAGCVAMLIGPDAPIVFEPGLRGSYLTHAYDFYKPDLTSEYPVVDGQHSLRCYTEAVDACYKAYDAREKVLKANQNGTNGAIDESKTPLDRFDYILYHAPTCKLVQKSYGRMLYNDYLNNPTHPAFGEVAPELRDISYDASVTDKSVEKTFMALTKKRFAERVNPGLQVATLCGNMYTATVYAGLASLLSFVPFSPSESKRIGLFSYGSGLAASMFSAKIVGDVSEMVEKLDLKNRLDSRTVLEPQAYDDMCKLREHAHLKKNFKPSGQTETLQKGTYYLTEVDDMFRRKYEIKA